MTVACTGVPPLESVKLVSEIVLASMSREKVAVGVAERAMPVAPSDGVVVTLGGGGGAGGVLNDQETGLASATPSVALIVVSSVAV